jgi:outer membrane receptor for ferrienterochelin and colicins
VRVQQAPKAGDWVWRYSPSMQFTNPHTLIPCVALWTALAASATTLPAVTVSAPAESDANTRTFDHDDLARFGDGGNLIDALRRLPGVQITPEGRIQLRGMGNGYTRVEINGQAVGGLKEGPMLDGFTVDMVESVEIVRGASASSSGEAVAGTLRISTRAATGRERLRLKAQVGSDAGRPSESLALQWSGSRGMLDYQLTARATQRRASPTDRAIGAGISPDGTAYYTDHTDTLRRNQTGGVSMEPQLVWRASPNDTLTLTSRAEQSSTRLDADKSFALQADWPAHYATSTERERSQFWSLRPQLQWKHRWDNGNRFTLDMGGSRQIDQGTWAQQQLDAAGDEVSAEGQQWRTRSSGHHLGLRWDVASSDALHWVLGTRLDAEAQRQTDTEDGEVSHSHVQRRQTAAFVQAKAQLAPGWRLDAGLRHERTQLDVGGDDASRHSTSGIWLPSATLAWDMAEQRTLRLNAGRTYRSPRLKDLSTSTRHTDWNVPGNPDTSGNPLLLPERATGIELGLEQALGEDGQQGEIGITLLQRRIQQRIQYQLDFVDDRWRLAPVNAGGARVQGLELDGRWALARTAVALPLTLRSSLGLYRSKLDDVDAPNGLPGQPRAVLNIGFDVQSATGPLRPLTWGGNFNTSPGYSVRTSSRQTLEIFRQRTLDLYAQWQFDPQTRLRVAGARLTGGTYGSVSHLMTDTYGNEQRDTTRQQAVWSATVALEKDF